MTGSPASTMRVPATWIGQHTSAVFGPERRSQTNSIGPPDAICAVDCAAVNSSISLAPGTAPFATAFWPSQQSS